jgi:NadR type nicotinamide-nucleotide adenylyltransferase
VARRGLIIGKFLPLHRGHRHLVETAQAQCDELTIALFARTDEPIPRAVRAAWIAELFPSVRVVGGTDDHAVDFADDAAWEHWTAATLAALDGLAPDVVFSSEDYGLELGRRLGAEAVLVDLDRAAVPVSGSMVRADPHAAWSLLDAPVRAWFAKRVAVVGAESTGKTTLCQRLAQHFDTAWVPEYGRAYCEVRGLDGTWTSDEFEVIAAQQLADEDAAARRANRVLFCDTDALATGIWHERYVGGARHPGVEAMVRPYDLYLVTAPDVPWVDDGLRDGEHVRGWMTARFVEELDARGARYELIAGSWPERDAAAIAAVERVLAEPWPGHAYRPDERNHTRRL